MSSSAVATGTAVPLKRGRICPVHGYHGNWSLSNKDNDGLESYCDKRNDDELCSQLMREPAVAFRRFLPPPMSLQTPPRGQGRP